MTPDVPTSWFPWLCRCRMIASKGEVGEAQAWADAVGAPDRVKRILKSPIGAGQTGNYEWAGAFAGDYRTVITAFVDGLRTRSIFFRLMDGGITRVPMRKRVGLMTSGASGWIVGEGQPTPLTKLQLANQLLEPVRAAALMVTTDELVRDVSAAGQTLFARELRGAVADVVDARFFDILGSVSTDVAIQSAGNDEDAIRLDLQAALLAVTTSGNSALFWVMSPDVAKRASTFTEIFPAMSAQGGEMVNLPALVTNVLSAGTLALIDASGIAGDFDTIELRASTQTAVEMSDLPTADAGSTLVSMFQTNGLALMATTLFAAEVLRANCVAMVTDIAWEI